MAEKIYRAGIVGCGRIASLFDSDPKRKGAATHAGAYSRHPRVELAAAADLNPQALKAFGERWNVANLYDDPAKMLREQQLDIVSVCTPTVTHRDIAMMALDAGARAIFCEKPIAASLGQADEMVRRCDEAGVLLAVNHLRRWDPLHHRAKDYVAESLGRVQQVVGYYTAGLANTASHLLDLLRFFFGDVEWAQAISVPDEAATDPCIDARLQFRSGTPATILSMDVKSYLIFQVDIFGTSGRLDIIHSGKEARVWRVDESHVFSGYQELFEQPDRLTGGLEGMMYHPVADLVECLDTGRAPISTGRDGLAALELIFAIRRSARNRGERIALPLADRSEPLAK